MNESVKKYLPGLLRYLSIRDRTRAELDRYLNRVIENSDTDQVKLQIIKYLEEQGLIDDLSFVTKWTESKLRKGQGYKRISYELQRLGVKEAVIREGLGAINKEAWIQSAAEYLKKERSKWNKLEPRLKKMQMGRRLLSRGFLTGQIQAAIDLYGLNELE